MSQRLISTNLYLSNFITDYTLRKTNSNLYDKYIRYSCHSLRSILFKCNIQNICFNRFLVKSTNNIFFMLHSIIQNCSTKSKHWNANSIYYPILFFMDHIHWAFSQFLLPRRKFTYRRITYQIQRIHISFKSNTESSQFTSWQIHKLEMCLQYTL